MNPEKPKRMTKVPETIEKMAEDWEVTFLSFYINPLKEIKDDLDDMVINNGYTRWFNNVITEIDLQVLKILEELNILPFGPKAIKKYQQDLIEPHELEYKNLIDKDLFKLKMFAVLFFTTLIACICGNIWNISMIKYLGWISLASIIAVILYSMTYDDAKQFHWCSINLKEYMGEIPLSVLGHANEIKKMLKESNFYIQKMRFSILGNNVDNIRFLIMIYSEKIYYIDIWDNSEFTETQAN